MLNGKRILLIISGGIAAYKSLELIRRLRQRGANVRTVMSAGACQFITPLSVGALSGDKVFTKLFDRDDEHDVGHIRLSREADMVVVAPASADLMAKMANGLANDLPSAVLLACDKPVLLAPAMNPIMWNNPATRRNAAALLQDGIRFIGPAVGEMAERGEAGVGRMAEPMEILNAIEAHFAPKPTPLAGAHVLITSGPTHEPIDPVRYIANRSSGKQGHAIAAAAAKAGAQVTLISGPVSIAPPAGVTLVRVETAREMLAAVQSALPADIAIMAAAVADWRAESGSAQKLKKDGSGAPPPLVLSENPDILATIGNLRIGRPKLVVGFAAETQNLIENAQGKLRRKGADLIVANDVSHQHGVMGGDDNTVRLVSAAGVEEWPKLTKDEVAARLIDHLRQLVRP